MENLEGLKRTHLCANVTSQEEGTQVTLMGWAQKRRDLGGVIFVDLRDISGIMQIVFSAEINQAVFDKADQIRNEYVLAIVGEVVKRAPEAINVKLQTGEIEVKVTELRILSKAETPPFTIEEDSDVNDTVRLKYRYLDLRRPDMQKSLIYLQLPLMMFPKILKLSKKKMKSR